MKTLLVLFLLGLGFMAHAQCSTISGPSSACENVAVTFSTIAGKSYYNWSVAGTILSGQGTNTVVVKMSSSYPNNVSVYYFNGSNPTTCQIYKTVTVSSNPMPTITGSSGICLPASGSSTLPYTTESNKTQYQWSMSPNIGTISSPNTQNTNITWSQGVTTLTVSYRQSNGCLNSKSMTVNAYSKPITPTISGPNDICFDNDPNTTYTYTVSPNVHTIYEWLVYGRDAAIVSSSRGSITLDFVPEYAPSFYVSYHYTDIFSGCPSDYGYYTVNATNPIPVITGPTNPCIGGGQLYSTESGNSNYVWTFTPSTAGVIDTNPPNVSNISTTWNTTGSISVKYVKNGCQSQPGSLNITKIGGGSCTSSRINVLPKTAISPEASINNSLTFPIPANDNLIVEFPESRDASTMVLTNAFGSIVHSSTKDPEERERIIPVGDLPEGTYFLTIKSKNHQETKRVLIKH